MLFVKKEVNFLISAFAEMIISLEYIKKG